MVAVVRGAIRGFWTWYFSEEYTDAADWPFVGFEIHDPLGAGDGWIEPFDFNEAGPDWVQMVYSTVGVPDLWRIVPPTSGLPFPDGALQAQSGLIG